MRGALRGPSLFVWTLSWFAEGMAAETSQTLDRGLRVLEVIAESPEGLTVTELASRLSISRTVVYRLVVTLERHALLRRGTDGRCRLGLGVLSLGRTVQPVVKDAAMPVLRLLADAVGATAVLVVADGPDAVTAAVVEPTRSDVHVTVRTGARVPLETIATGRAILAARTAGERPLDPPWVLSSSEPGSISLGVPVQGVAGWEAAIGVVSSRELAEGEVGPRVARAAGELARALR